ncbi:MAG: hypothetical protein P4L73_16665 [Caulobacteraceae bacterium]|nr:hypothetical protein [Caulobacteraceae bacterium]
MLDIDPGLVLTLGVAASAVGLLGLVKAATRPRRAPQALRRTAPAAPTRRSP